MKSQVSIVEHCLKHTGCESVFVLYFPVYCIEYMFVGFICFEIILFVSVILRHPPLHNNNSAVLFIKIVPYAFLAQVIWLSWLLELFYN